MPGFKTLGHVQGGRLSVAEAAGTVFLSVFLF